ncbi:hypothetical protein APC62_07425 [Acinetobacter pittii]|uniref:DUF4882 family protein n=1 Tax=Acinetobacter pittii TaxID=48296 RepID=UPI00070C5575|nr:DUF4882 family protein [Acinetobacter pittii]KRI62318.1 hypothetical protein APC62_07425 [Acinetobacter pittii]MDX8164862.1 DUF4882 family protein [Acinetobacter pittii]
MKKEIILALSCLLPFPVLADCNVGAMTLTGASNSGQWSSLVTLTGQKLTSYTQANNSLESQAATNSPTNLPASNIIAFEYRSVTPINLIGNEQTAGWLLHSSSTNGTVTSGALFTPTSDSTGLNLVLVGVGNPTPKYQSFETLNSGSNRIGVYINRQSKQIGYILNGVNKGYKWTFTDPINNISFALLNGFSGFTASSSNLGKEVTMELITDHSLLQYTYPTGATDICGNSL